MSIEIPSTEIIEAEIVRLNGQLENLGKEAKSQGPNPVDLEQTVVDRLNELRPNLTPAAFWSHYISGGVGSVANLPPDMSEMIGPVQKRLQILTQRWMTHPVGEADQLNLVSCKAFLDAGFAFDWTQEPVLLNSLSSTLANLGNQYSLREGRIPLGYTPY